MFILQIQMMPMKFVRMSDAERIAALDRLEQEYKDHAKNNTSADNWDEFTVIDGQMAFDENAPESKNSFPQWLKEIIVNVAPHIQFVGEHAVYKGIYPDGRMVREAVNTIHAQVAEAEKSGKYPEFFHDYAVKQRVLLCSDEAGMLEMNPSEERYQQRVLELTVGGDEDIFKMLEKGGVRIEKYLEPNNKAPVKALPAAKEAVIKSPDEPDTVEGKEMELQ
jgi:hypothetical protein